MPGGGFDLCSGQRRLPPPPNSYTKCPRFRHKFPSRSSGLQLGLGLIHTAALPCRIRLRRKRRIVVTSSSTQASSRPLPRLNQALGRMSQAGQEATAFHELTAGMPESPPTPAPRIHQGGKLKAHILVCAVRMIVSAAARQTREPGVLPGRRPSSPFSFLVHADWCMRTECGGRRERPGGDSGVGIF